MINPQLTPGDTATPGNIRLPTVDTPHDAVRSLRTGEVYYEIDGVTHVANWSVADTFEPTPEFYVVRNSIGSPVGEGLTLDEAKDCLRDYPGGSMATEAEDEHSHGSMA